MAEAGAMWEDVVSLAAERAGTFTRSQAKRLGISDDKLATRLRRGDCVRLRPGVFGVVGIMATDAVARHAADIAAAQERVRRPTVGSHSSALVCHGVALLNPPGDVNLTATKGEAVKHKGLHLHVAGLPADHIHDKPFRGLNLTTPARSLVDFARRASFVEAVIALDDALRKGKTSKSRVRDVLNHCREWPGALSAERAVGFADRRSESVLESASRVLFHEHGLPPPSLQTVIEVDELAPVRTDFYWPEFRVVGEADGKVKYMADENEEPDKNARDALWVEKRRQEALENAGFIVVRWGWVDIFRAPQRTVARVLAAMERGERLRR